MFTCLPPINWRISQPSKVSFSPPWQMSSLQHRQHRSQNWAHVLVAHVPILKGKAILATLSRIVDVCRCEFKKRLTPQFMVSEKIMDHWDHWMKRGIWYLGVPPRKQWCVTPFSPRIQDTKRCTKAEDKDPHLGAACAAGAAGAAGAARNRPFLWVPLASIQEYKPFIVTHQLRKNNCVQMDLSWFIILRFAFEQLWPMINGTLSATISVGIDSPNMGEIRHVPICSYVGKLTIRCGKKCFLRNTIYV